MKNLELLIPQAQPEPDLWRWATVTAINPLRIRLDGEVAALDTTPDNTIGPLKVGNRVWTQTTARRILVVGVAGGVKEESVGVIKIWPTTTPPLDHLICNGSTFSSNTYPELAALLGNRFGTPSGTTYYLPDMSGRTVVGLSSDTEFNVIGKLFGAKTHTLSVNEMPSHNHTHRQWVFNGASAGGTHYGMSFQNGTGTWYDTASASTTETGYGNYPTGGGAAHNNIQPSITMNYVIRAK